MLSMLDISGGYMGIQSLFSTILWKFSKYEVGGTKNPHWLLVLLCFSHYPEYMSSPFLFASRPFYPRLKQLLQNCVMPFNKNHNSRKVGFKAGISETVLPES